MAKLLEAQKQKNAKKMNLYLSIIFGVVSAYVFAHAAYLIDRKQMSLWMALVRAFMDVLEFSDLTIYPFSKNSLVALFSGICVGGILYLFLMTDYERHRHYTTDEECGTAKFNDMDKDIDEFNKKYSEPFGSKEHDGSSNMIMSKNVYISTDFWKTQINCNVTVFGTAGTGKSFRIAKPNLLQANCSYVVTDPSGELVKSVGHFLKKMGYRIRIFNISDMKHSNGYNPFAYIRNDAGVMMLVKCLIKNTNDKEAKKGDDFWAKAEEALLSAIIYYLKDFVKDKTQQNFESVMKFMRAGELDENNPNGKTKLDLLFDECPRNSMAWKNYKTFRLAPTKTRMSIMISLGVRLNPFNVEDLANLTRVDELDMSRIGFERTALFIITPQADRTYNFMASILYSQFFETQYHIGENELPPEAGNRLPIHVRCIMDEVANIGEIPSFPSLMSTMRKYNISATPIWQSLSQMKSRYKDDWEEMLSNSSTLILLGTNEETTAEYFSKLMGKTTIRQRNRSLSDGNKKSSSKSYQQTARNLMEPSEIVQMDSSECIVIVTGCDPIRDQKYDASRHVNWNETKTLFNYKTMSVYDMSQSDERILFIKQMQIMSNMEAYKKISRSMPVGNGGITQEKKEEEAYNEIVPVDEVQVQTLMALQTQKIYNAAMKESGKKIIIVNEGPIPTRTLTYLVHKTTTEFKRPCIIFANNINQADELCGIASLYGNYELKQILEQLSEHPLLEKEGFIEIRIPYANYGEFRKKLLEEVSK